MDRRRSAGLLLDSELRAGTIGEPTLDHDEVKAATRVSRIPPRPVRLAQQVLYKLGRLSYEQDIAAPLVAARRAVLGEKAASPTRLLVRVDEFPHYRAWDDPKQFGTRDFERFHEIMAGAGVPYLIAALPRVARQPLSVQALGSRAWEDDEVEMAGRLASDGVTFAVHGLDHRTRHSSSRRHSELSGLSARQTEELVERALGELTAHGVDAKVFVAPYNRFDADQLPVLARRFSVVCGGPESIGALGFQRTPQWRGETVYLPAYAPLYGRAADVLPAARRAIEQSRGLWIPIVLHWGWEAQDGWQALERLAACIAEHSEPWEEFLAAVARSRAIGDGDRVGDGDGVGDGEGDGFGDGDRVGDGDGDRS